MSIVKPQKILFNESKKIENIIEEIETNDEIVNVILENRKEENIEFTDVSIEKSIFSNTEITNSNLEKTYL